MFSIGEFSKISGLTLKALHLYHERGLLVPSYVDPDSGYRYYDDKNVQTARTLSALRAMEFTLAEIETLLGDYEAGSAPLGFLERKRRDLEAQRRKLREAARAIDRVLREETEAEAVRERATALEERELPPLLVASVRWRGTYGDCGAYFSKVARKVGRYICGAPLNLYYDGEFKESDADIETCYPIKRAVAIDGITVRELPAQRCLSLVHQGPYSQIGLGYEKLLAAVHARGLRVALPSREIYLKGPGMIFSGNPKKYVTEIQVSLMT